MSTEAALAIVNARIWTNDPRRPWADAILIRGERIEAVGSSAEVKKRDGPDTRTIDAKGMMVVPGAAIDGSVDMQALYTSINRRGNPDPAPTSAVAMLQAGTIADLTIIDRDLTRIAVEMTGDAQVVLTVVRGRILTDRVTTALDQSGHG